LRRSMHRLNRRTTPERNKAMTVGRSIEG
jgi:hypothetical protein